MLALAAAAEADREHPLARAIVDAARRRGLAVPRAADFRSSPAVGVDGDGRRPRGAGRRAPAARARRARPSCPRPPPWRDDGAIILHVLRRRRRSSARWRSPTRCGRSRGRPSTRCTRRGVQVVMITGDAEAVADVGRRRARHRPGIRRRAPRGQGGQGGGAAGRGPQGRDGRRRRQRRPGARAGRRRHRDRRRHRRRDRLGRRHPRQRRPALGAVGDRAVEGAATAR